ncbi:hypothetical protein INT44_000780 [Umbelopsis vinacea]|uniref:2-oxoglutarate dehydrogenase, mitochondrial n=1 Tax=Umbelopsis vinacea TaxID=44442 RepID=A0A8H7QA43_9FUNG|nr:hypothetical protein INT44_000780 [Umbelopsis vinacea]
MQRLITVKRRLPGLLYAQHTPSSYYVTSRKLHTTRTSSQQDSGYSQAMYSEWKRDPQAVHESWRKYFESGGAPSSGAAASSSTVESPVLVPIASARLPSLPDAVPLESSEDVMDHMKIQLLVRAYQARGHHIAKLDPLGILDPDLDPEAPKELKLSYYGFKDNDLEKTFTLGPGALPGIGQSKLTLQQVVDHLKHIYCGSIGSEYIHIPNKDECDWLRERLEKVKPYDFSRDEKYMMLDRLMWSSIFEQFVATKYPGEKRFGLEGAESLIAGMKAMVDRSVDHGVQSIIIGMPHRGRLNILSNVIRKPNESIFCEFMGVQSSSVEGSGDVKYHLGMNYVRPTPSGKRVHLSLIANPAHLEAVGPVVLGKTKALQFYSDDGAHDSALAIILHGDAAFAAQGVVYESMSFHDTPEYATGGSIHVVVNNQIGFTTDPRYARSTPYCTDIAKSINAPILHVNADDVEAVTFVMQLAADWRKTFKKDIVVDLVCYRRHGHNEADQPSFTQPAMYDKIAKQKPVLDQYIEQLKNEGVFSDKDIEENRNRIQKLLEESYARSKEYNPTSREWLSSSWPGFRSPKEVAEQILPQPNTGVPKDILEKVGRAISHTPEDFTVHRGVQRILSTREKNIQAGKDIDWSTAEALAVGTLLLEGKHVRISGQDVERGTFSQRHAILHDQKKEEQYTPLKHISGDQAKFSISNSTLSEYGVLGFELGYSLADPNALVVWEAQFGDFANTAQCIIDLFIASGEKKWLQRTGLTLSLPHGYDGQGPEHSSTRIERFLQLCDDHPYIYPSEEKLQRIHQDCNMQVVYPTTPANYFHALRRQIHREYRKPLILPFSKSLLRHPLARSSLEDMTGDNGFKLYIPEPHPDSLAAPEEIKKHVLCSGQVYYALLRARDENKLNDIAISRVEQISPFPWSQVKEHVDKYPNAQIVWCQEEPLNMGAWQYVQPRLITTLAETQHHKDTFPIYASRPPSASIATGNKKQHKQEEYSFLSKALLGVTKPEPKDVVSGVPIWDIPSDAERTIDNTISSKDTGRPPSSTPLATSQQTSSSSPKEDSPKEADLEALGGAVDAIPKDEQSDTSEKEQPSKGFFGWLSGKR